MSFCSWGNWGSEMIHFSKTQQLKGGNKFVLGGKEHLKHKIKRIVCAVGHLGELGKWAMLV